jgi:hypothetical protein
MCSTKIRHPSREAALNHVKQLVWSNHIRGRSALSVGLGVYPCERCLTDDGRPSWHVGHERHAPSVWHYTVVDPYLDRILASDALKPAKPRRPPRRLLAGLDAETRAYALAYLGEREPLLWFSWNQEWEYSVTKVRMQAEDEDDDDVGHAYVGRAMTEICGGGLVRFGVPASCAKLRWSDYLARNPTHKKVRAMMTRYGRPAEWLATDDHVPLGAVRAIQVYYRGAWTDVDDVTDEDFAAYLAERPTAYRDAQRRLRDEGRDRVLSEPERILVADTTFGNVEFA